MVERYSFFAQQTPGGGFVVGVLYRKVHVDMPAHGADHVADRISGGEARLVLVCGPQHPHGLVALVLSGKQPLAIVVGAGSSHASGPSGRNHYDDSPKAHQKYTAGEICFFAHTSLLSFLLMIIFLDATHSNPRLHL